MESGVTQQAVSIHPLLAFLGLFVVAVALSYGIRWLWRTILEHVAGKTSTILDDLVLRATRGAAQAVFIAASLNFLWNMYGGDIMTYYADIEILDVSFVGAIMDHVCFLLLTFSILALLWKGSFAVTDWYEREIAHRTETTLDEKIIHSLRKVLKGVFMVVAFMIVTDHFKLPFGKIWAAAGIGSLAVALAAQDTFANMISGIIILVDRPFLVGDRIELADGTYGDVIDIGLRSTKIMSFDNTIYILPNSDLSAQRITNHTYPDFKIKVSHTIGVAYGSDMVHVKTILNDILRNHQLVLNEPEWGIWFTEFADSSLNILVKYWISDYRNKFTVMDEINMEINRRFEAENIEIPFPQRDIHIIQPDGDA